MLFKRSLHIAKTDGRSCTSFLFALLFALGFISGTINDSFAQCNNPPCTAGNIQINISITTDNFPNEVSWVISDLTTGLPGCGIAPFGNCLGGLNSSGLLPNTSYTWSLCFPAGNTLQFIISDAASDGICCGFGNGSYTVSACSGTSVFATGGAFGCSETTTFTVPLDCCGGLGCPSCSNGLKDCTESGVDCGGPCCPVCPPISASDCALAVNICTTIDFQIQPDGWGLIKEIPPLGTIGNPDNNNPGGSGNWGCLRTPPPPPPSNPGPENNSTWMIVNIDNSGLLNFTFGGNGTQTGFYDWIMYPWNPNVCTDIPTGNYAPVRCNWNSNASGGTGLASTLPPGGFAGNYEPSLPVICGEKYIICFSNWSSVTTNVPLEFYGTASVTCNPFDLLVSVIPPNPVICIGESVALTANGADTYTWSPATGLSDTTGTVVIASPTTTTTYSVTGLTGCFTGDTTVTVIVQDPGAGFTFSGPQCLTTNNISFTNTGDTPGSCGAGCPTYTWDFGDGAGTTGTNASAANPSHVYGSGNVYTVTQIVDDSLCTATFSLDVVISDPLSTIIGTEESCFAGCDGAVDFTVSGGLTPYTYTWNTGPTTQDVINVCAGFYSITTVDALGCSVTDTVTLNPFIDVAAGFTYNNNQCLDGNFFIFTNTGTAPGSCGGNCPLYWWNFGDSVIISGTDVSSANPLHTYSAIGTYTVTQVLTDGSGCSDTAKTNVVVFQAPTAGLVSVDESCFNACNGSITLTVTGGASIATYSWSNGASTQNISGLCGGNYSVTITDINGCIDSTNIVLNTGTEIKAGYTFNGNQCLSGNNFDFINTGSVPGVCGLGCPTYTWNFGDLTGVSGTTIAEAGPSHTYGTSGIFTVSQIVSDGICADTLIQTITVSAQPTITIVPTNGSCSGNCDGLADLTVTSGTPPYTYNWSNFETAPDVDNLCTGTYTVTVTDSNGCTVINSIVITTGLALTAALTTTDVNCKGGSDGTATATPVGGAFPFTYIWSNGDNTATADSLIAGTFYVTVTDSSGCTAIDTVIIIEPPTGLGSSVVSTDVNCNGGSNGSATVTATGGTTPYSYTWSNGDTSATADSLTQGTFTITVTDASNCTDTNIATIIEPTAMLLTSGNINASCGASDGKAYVSATGGTGPYIYLWNDVGAQTTDTAFGVSAGAYVVVVTDSAGCVDSATASVSNVGAPSVTITAVANVQCNGGNDGTATVTPVGGIMPYTYSWNDPLMQTTAIAVGLAVGTYVATVTDSAGCIATAVQIITQPTALILTSGLTNANCGKNDGSGSVSASGGTMPYTYLWNDPSTQTTVAAVGLFAGNFQVVVTDSNNCKDSVIIVISDIPGGAASIASFNNVNCNSACDGNATGAITGGTTPYSYSWNDPSAQTTALATGLCFGSYYVITTDSNGCADTANVIITEPTALLAGTDSIDASCNGVCDGVLISIVSGGTGSFTYLWSNSTTNDSALGLCAGPLTLTVTDANGCNATSIGTVNEPTALSLTMASVGATCNGANGEASVNVTGGAAPYTYQWNDPGAQTTDTAINLFSGTYLATITDSAGCIDTATIIVQALGVPTANITTSVNVSCNGGSDGNAGVTASNGILPYTYGWDDPGAQTTDTAYNLTAGFYTVTITDADGCFATDTITITEPAAMAAPITVTDVSCFGGSNGSLCVSVSGGTGPYTYSWCDGSTISCLTASVAITNCCVDITDNNGCTIQICDDIAEPTSILIDSSTFNNPNCNSACTGTAAAVVSGGVAPYTYLWNDLASQTVPIALGLCDGTYIAAVTDGNGCTETATYIIVEPLPIILTVSGNFASCEGLCDGTSIVKTQGQYPPFNFIWSNGQTDSIATGLCVGVYTVTVTDAVGCIESNAYTVVQNPNAPVADFTIFPNPSSLYEPNIAFANLSLPDLASLTFVWDFGDSSTSIIANPLHLYEDSGTYTVQLIVLDIDNCSDTLTQIVTIEGIYSIHIPNSFSPNKDGLNDDFIPIGIGIDNKYFKMYIFDRWGDQVYYTDNYNKPWDGHVNNGKKIAQEDVYVWMILTRDEGENKPHQYVGHVTLVR